MGEERRFTERDIEQFGGGGTMVDEQTGQVVVLIEKVTEAAKSLGEVAEQLGGEKTKKGTKGFGKMLKTLTGISPQAIILEKLMILLQPFLNIIDLINPLLEVLAGIFEEALMPIVEAIIPIIMMLVEGLMQNKDIIISLINIALIPLIKILDVLAKFMKDNEEIINELVEAIRPLLKMIEEMISEIMESEEVVWALNMGLQGLIVVLRVTIIVIRAIVIGIRWLRDAIKGLIGWVNSVAKAVEDLTGGGGGGGGITGGIIPGLQGEGIVMREGIFRLAEKKPEVVMNLDRFAGLTKTDPEQLYLLEESNRNQEEILAILQRDRRR